MTTSQQTKQESLQVLVELIDHVPDVQFGQLVANLAVTARRPEPTAVWDVADDELLAAVRSHATDSKHHPVGI